jgi:hypothetical protein
VNDPELVRGAQSTGHLANDVHRLEHRNAVGVLQAVGQALPVQVFHHQEHHALGRGPEIGHVDDVGMTDAAGGLGLDQELLDHVLLAREVVVQHLDGDRLFDDHVLGAVHHAHAALADDALDLVIFEDHTHARHDLLGEQRRAVMGTAIQGPGDLVATARADACGWHADRGLSFARTHGKVRKNSVASGAVR